jgi:hypothetical protein
MVEMACEYLPTAKLNWLSVHMAIHMDSEEVERGATFHSGLSRQIREEIEREQATSKRGRRSTQTRFEKGVSPEDRKLFRQFGIKT